MNSLFYQSFGCYQEFTLHCRNLNVGWFSPYLPIFRVVEWTYISLKISRFQKKISRAPFQLGSSGEAGVGWGREERGASIVHPQYLHPPPKSTPAPNPKWFHYKMPQGSCLLHSSWKRNWRPPFIGKILLRRAPIPSTIPPEHSQVFSQGKDQQWPKRNKKVTKRRRYAK